jgi:hypothetical protein
MMLMVFDKTPATTVSNPISHGPLIFYALFLFLVQGCECNRERESERERERLFGGDVWEVLREYKA